jgi:hypothetical protein
MSVLLVADSCRISQVSPTLYYPQEGRDTVEHRPTAISIRNNSTPTNSTQPLQNSGSSYPHGLVEYWNNAKLGPASQKEVFLNCFHSR